MIQTLVALLVGADGLCAVGTCDCRAAGVTIVVLLCSSLVKVYRINVVFDACQCRTINFDVIDINHKVLVKVVCRFYIGSEHQTVHIHTVCASEGKHGIEPFVGVHLALASSFNLHHVLRLPRAVLA